MEQLLGNRTGASVHINSNTATLHFTSSYILSNGSWAIEWMGKLLNLARNCVVFNVDPRAKNDNIISV